MNGIPVHFIELAPDIARRSIEGHRDELMNEHQKAEALYRAHVRCPRGCGTTMQKHAAHPTFAFSDPNWLVPRCLMKCTHCGAVLNPFDGMLVELGDPDAANAGAPVLRRAP